MCVYNSAPFTWRIQRGNRSRWPPPVALRSLRSLFVLGGVSSDGNVLPEDNNFPIFLLFFFIYWIVLGGMKSNDEILLVLVYFLS